MASRRMFSINFIESDAFCNLSQGAKLLYFYLMASADDDGFTTNLRKGLFLAATDNNSFKELVDEGFVIQMNKAVVITHWKQHNYIQSDRYRKTIYRDDLKKLGLTDDQTYYLLDTGCIQTVSIGKDSTVQDSLGKTSQGKFSQDKDRQELGKSEGEEPTLPIDEPTLKLYCKDNHINLDAIPKSTLELIKSSSDWKAKLDLAALQYK